LLGLKGGVNPTKTGSVNGYHPGDYSYPRNSAERFEICCGAVLTQNTSWPQVEKALLALKDEGLLSSTAMHYSDVEKIKPRIKPAGYFNQKAQYLKELTSFFINLRGVPRRDDVLGIKGVGDETADSIMLYAFGQASFVVDAYTHRIFTRMGLVEKDAKYLEIKKMFEDALATDVELYQEYHALIVEHAKRHCKTKPECEGCVLKEICKY